MEGEGVGWMCVCGGFVGGGGRDLRVLVVGVEGLF